MKWQRSMKVSYTQFGLADIWFGKYLVWQIFGLVNSNDVAVVVNAGQIYKNWFGEYLVWSIFCLVNIWYGEYLVW